MTNHHEPIRIFSGELEGQRLTMATADECIVIQIDDTREVHSYGFHSQSNSFFYDRMPALPHHIELFQLTAKRILGEVEQGRFEVLTLEEAR